MTIFFSGSCLDVQEGEYFTIGNRIVMSCFSFIAVHAGISIVVAVVVGIFVVVDGLVMG